MAAASRLSPAHCGRQRSPTLIGLMAATGLRTGEAKSWTATTSTATTS